MQDWQIERYTIHSRSSRYLKRVAETKELIKEALKFMENPYVAFSCGKDSSVLAHLVLQQRDMPLRFLSSGETRIVHNIDDIIGWFKDRGATVEEILVDRVFSEEWKNATWTEQRKAGRHDMELLNVGNWDGIFMGLRIEESPNRKRSLLMLQTEGLPPFCYRYKETNKKRGNIIRCCPLARWTTDDIGAYLVTNNIPFLRQYHNHGMESRTTARLTGDAVRQYVLSDIKRDNPEGWRKLVKRFPEFSYFV